ncbi:MAG: hypothetical protein HKN24_13575 [Acidimicrobiales bacterium]|nr:hypothetical protein [Acidimicrobiales bacterium]
MRPVLVAAALSNRDWRPALQRHVRDHEADVVVELVRDRHQARAQDVDIVVVDDDTSWVSAAVVASLIEAGKRVVGIFDPAEADGYGEQFLRSLGIDLVVPADLPTEALIAFLRQHRPDREQTAQDAAALEHLDDRIPGPQRRIVAVGGPSGSGVTEVAVGLCQLLAGESTILVDTDENHPGVSRRLGLNIHPHIVTATDLVRRGSAAGEASESLSACLARPAISPQELPFDVISGLASRDDWSLLRADETVALLDLLAQRWRNVVAKVGSTLDDLPGTQRYEVSRQVLRRAERIIAVTHASPTGLLHFVDWLVEAVPLVGDAPVDVVVNKAPANPAMRGEIETELVNITGDRMNSLLFVPADKRVERAAWDATLVSKGPFLRHLSGLLGTVPSRLGWRNVTVAERRPKAA